MMLARFKTSNWRDVFLSCAILAVSLQLIFIGERLAALSLVAACVVTAIINLN
jgi:hypothetical protein